MALPQNIPYALMLTTWGAAINPLIDNALVKGVSLSGIVLNAGTAKAIPTGLNRTQQGWFLTDIMSNAVVWRTESFNDKTLTLQSSADTTVSIWVY